MVYNKKNPPFIANFPELMDPVSLEHLRTESLKPLPKPTNEPLVLHNDLPNIPIAEPKLEKKELANDAEKKKKDSESSSSLPLILILVAIIIAILNASF
jgi:hypothetical protein